MQAVQRELQLERATSKAHKEREEAKSKKLEEMERALAAVRRATPLLRASGLRQRGR